jgi:hypothetical protein
MRNLKNTIRSGCRPGAYKRINVLLLTAAERVRFFVQEKQREEENFAGN